MSSFFESRFDGLKAKFNKEEAPVRQQAFDYFKSQGVPTRKD